MTHYVNLGDKNSPRLVPTLNLLTINGGSENALSEAKHPNPKLKLSLKGMSLSSEELARIKQDQFQAIQSHLLFPTNTDRFQKEKLLLTAAAILTGKKLSPGYLDQRITAWKKQGYCCATIIAGTGKESQSEAIEITKRIIDASARHEFPLFIELHRASITESIQQTLDMVDACPKVMFNADFSHYILSYRLDQVSNSALESTLDLMSPIFERVGYLHGRYACSNHIQSTQGSNRAKDVYHLLISKVFSAFKRNAKDGDAVFFAPELLPRFTGYCHVTRSKNGHIEHDNRYQHALDLIDQANQIFSNPLTSDESFPHDENVRQNTVDITSKEELCQFVSRIKENAQATRVRLGNQLLSSEEEKGNLIDAFYFAQRRNPSLCLETARNTVTHNIESTLSIIKRYPDIKLRLNVSEWILGEEITIEHLGKFKQRIKPLLGNVGCVSEEFATAEYRYDRPIKYAASAFTSPSVLIENQYSAFYKKLKEKVIE